jgi:hypothetical protein
MGFTQDQNWNWLDGMAALEDRMVFLHGNAAMGRAGTFEVDDIAYLSVKSIDVLEGRGGKAAQGLSANNVTAYKRRLYLQVSSGPLECFTVAGTRQLGIGRFLSSLCWSRHYPCSSSILWRQCARWAVDHLFRHVPYAQWHTGVDASCSLWYDKATIDVVDGFFSGGKRTSGWAVTNSLG